MSDPNESRDDNDSAKRKEAEAMLSSPSPDQWHSSTPPQEPTMAPDGGWGWVIVISSFFISVIVDGIGYSFGIVKGDLDEHFQTASSTSAWAGSLLNGVYLSVGPIASALSNRFGCRAVCMTGSAIAAVAIFISGFSTNIEMLLITYGVLGGIGFGLMYLPAIVMVGYYFDKRRALATGIAVCGSGIGTVILAPLASILLENFGWGGTNIILAGVILNGIVFGAFYRPLKTIKREIDATSDPDRSYVMESIIKDKRTRCYSTHEPEVDHENRLTVPTGDNGTFLNGTPARDTCNDEAVQLVADEELDKTQNPSAKQTRSRTVSTRSNNTEEKKPMDRKDALYTGSIKALPEYQECQGDMNTYVQSVTSLHQPDKNRSNSVRGIISEMFDLSLLKSPTVILICLSGFLSFSALYTPFVYAPAKSESLGESIQRSSLIVTVLGATNTACRVLAGLIVDLPFVDCVLVNTVAIIAAGILTCLVCFFNTWELLMLYAALFGVCMAAFVTLRSIVIADLLGVSKLNNAYGLLSLCQGLAVMIGSPLAGAMYDATQSYNMPFIVSGVMFIIGGLLSLPMRRVSQWEKSRQVRLLKDNTATSICTDETLNKTTV